MTPVVGARVERLADALAAMREEFRTEVGVDGAFGALVVTGVLPATAWRPTGGIAIGPSAWGDGVRTLSSADARKLAAALHEVADRIDVCSDERYGPIDRTDAERGEWR